MVFGLEEELELRSRGMVRNGLTQPDPSLSDDTEESVMFCDTVVLCYVTLSDDTEVQ